MNPVDKVGRAVTRAFCKRVLHAPHGLEVDIFHIAVHLQRERKIGFRGQRGIALLDARANTPVFCNGARAVALVGWTHIVHRVMPLKRSVSASST